MSESIKDNNLTNEILKDGSKIDLTIKHDQEEEEGISLVNVFGNIKKKWNVFSVMSALLVAVGVSAPLLYSEVTRTEPSATTVLTLCYDSNGGELDPNGDSLNISNTITSSYILNNALTKAKLSSRLTNDAVKSNMSITHVTTEAYKQRVELISELKTDSAANLEAILATLPEYEARYTITLDNNFKINKKEITLTNKELSILLNSITESYNDYFYETYTYESKPEDRYNTTNGSDADYLEQLDALDSAFNYLQNYCNAKAYKYSSFRSLSDGSSFSDYASTIAYIKSNNYDATYAQVYFNNLTKNQNTLEMKYEYNLRNYTQQLSEVTAQIASLDTTIANFENDKIVISGTDGNNNQNTVTKINDYYNELILSKVALENKKSTIQRNIEDTQDKLDRISLGNTLSETQIAEVESDIELIEAMYNNIYARVYTSSEELLVSDNVKHSTMVATSSNIEDESFISSSTLKMEGIGLAAAIFLALAIMACDGFIKEFKKGGEKNEKAIQE